MKNLLKIAAFSSLAFILASCGSANEAYGTNSRNNYPGNFPTNNGGIYRTSDGNIYRHGDIYRDRSGNIYQNGRVIRSGDVNGRPGILGKSGNAVYYPNTSGRRLPPGQAKKIYGGNAKDYAPGQVKKRSWDAAPNIRNEDQRNYRKTDSRKFDDQKSNKSKRKYKNTSRKG